MAEAITRKRAGLAGYFSRHIRTLTHEVRRMLQVADRDSDPVSITVLSRGPKGADHLADGAVVILKGGATVALFCQWAERNGVLTRGKPICDDKAGMVASGTAEDDDEVYVEYSDVRCRRCNRKIADIDIELSEHRGECEHA